MSKASRRAAALRAAPLTAAKRADARRADTRAETLANLGHAATAYAGLTPTTIDGAPVMHSNGIGWGMRSREARGTTIRAGKKGGLRLVRPRYDGDAPKRGGAHLTAGDFLVNEAGQPAERRERDADGNLTVDRGPAAYVARAVPGNTTVRVPTSDAAIDASPDRAARGRRDGVMRLRSQAADQIVVLGKHGAPPPPDDTGDTVEDVRTAAYFTRLRIERGDIRPEDIDPATGQIKEV